MPKTYTDSSKLITRLFSTALQRRGGTMYRFCPRMVVSSHLRRPQTHFRTRLWTRFRTRFCFQHFPEPRRNLVSVFLVIFCFFPCFFLFFSVFSPVFPVFSLFFSFFVEKWCILYRIVSLFSPKTRLEFVSFPIFRRKLASNSVSFPISRRKLASNSVSFPISRWKLASNRLVFKKQVSPTPTAADGCQLREKV